jgi:hypothetical protein
MSGCQQFVVDRSSEKQAKAVGTFALRDGFTTHRVQEGFLAWCEKKDFPGLTAFSVGR